TGPPQGSPAAHAPRGDARRGTAVSRRVRVHARRVRRQTRLARRRRVAGPHRAPGRRRRPPDGCHRHRIGALPDVERPPRHGYRTGARTARRGRAGRPRGRRCRVPRVRRARRGTAPGVAAGPATGRAPGAHHEAGAVDGDHGRGAVPRPGRRTRLARTGQARRSGRVGPARTGLRGHRRPGGRTRAGTPGRRETAARRRRDRRRRRATAQHRRDHRGRGTERCEQEDAMTTSSSTAGPLVTGGTATEGGVGASPARPDGTRKVRGEFAYSSDLWHEDMLWGGTLRSPYPHARITRIDTSRALALPGVYAVLTHDDVPGLNRYGLEHPDQPVLAEDVVRYCGEPVAVVAADHPEIAQRAVALIDV